MNSSTEYTKHSRNIIEAIDMDEWKHSRHLNKTSPGTIAWGDTENLDKIADILAEQRRELAARKARIDKAEASLYYFIPSLISQ